MALRKLLGWTFVVAALAVAFSAAPAMAASASFKVQTTADGNQAHPGTTNCATASDAGTGGKCTLRSSIEAADNEPSGTDVTIDVPAGTYKFSVANPPCIQCAPPIQSSYQLEILSGPSSITITGAGASSTIIDANSLDRVFDVASGATAKLTGVTIERGATGGATSGQACPSSPTGSGSGGGIDDSGKLTLSNDVVKNNVAVGDGGGIEDDSTGGPLTIKDSTFRANKTCAPSSTPPDGNGGAIDESHGDAVMIDSSTFTGNTAAGDGGAMDEAGGVNGSEGSFTITNSTIDGNTSGGSGGGIASELGFADRPPPGAAPASTSAAITLFADLLADNTAAGTGGGVNSASDQTSIVNTTITKNTAQGGGGGGIYMVFAGATVSFSTIYKNTGTISGPLASAGGNIDGCGDCGGNVSLDDSIVAAGSGTPTDCNGNVGITDKGFNLFDNTQCGSKPTDRIRSTSEVEATTGPLANNGGSTMTDALLAGSPAIDHASLVKCQAETKDSSGDPVDQRLIAFHGQFRPQGAGCDIGAFEATPNLAVNSSSQKDSIFVGQQDTITDTIGNLGPTEALASTLTDPGAGFKIDSVTTDKGTCTHTSTMIECQLGTILSSGRAKVSFVITGLAPGTIPFHAQVATKGDDRDQANNHAGTSVTVKKRPAPPPPAKPSASVLHLGPSCHPVKSTINLKAMAKAAAGIRSLALSVSGKGFSKRWVYHAPHGKTVRKQTLSEQVQGSALSPGQTYRVVAEVVDTLGRADKAHTTFTVCKPPKRGFTG